MQLSNTSSNYHIGQSSESSRSRQVIPHPKVTHLTAGLLNDSTSLIELFRTGAQDIDYVSFSAYLADPDTDPASKINSNMLQKLHHRSTTKLRHQLYKTDHPRHRHKAVPRAPRITKIAHARK